MRFSLNDNLNNLNYFWQALKVDEQNGQFTHKSWPNKHWQADFNFPELVPSTNLPKNKVVSTVKELTNPEDLGLEIKNQLVIMNLKLAQLNELLNDSNHVNIVKLSVGDDISKWVKGCSEAFGYEIDSDIIEHLLNNENASIFAYMKDGEIAGTAISYKTGNTLGIHQLGTAPNYRKMGVALSLMQHLFAQALTLKCELVSLQASKAGLHMYEKLGFKPLGKLTSYSSF